MEERCIQYIRSGLMTSVINATFNAVKRGDVPSLENFIDHEGVSVEARDENNKTLLSRAYESNAAKRDEIVKFLRRRGAQK